MSKPTFSLGACGLGKSSWATKRVLNFVIKTIKNVDNKVVTLVNLSKNLPKHSFNVSTVITHFDCKYAIV